MGETRIHITCEGTNSIAGRHLPLEFVVDYWRVSSDLPSMDSTSWQYCPICELKQKLAPLEAMRDWWEATVAVENRLRLSPEDGIEEVS